MAKIKLTDKYYFTADNNQYILLECGVRKKIDRRTRQVTDEDIEYEDVIGYFITLSAMLTTLVESDCRQKIANGDVTSIRDCISDMNELYENILDKTKGY